MSMEKIPYTPPTPPLSLRCYDSAYCTCGLVPNMGSMVYSIGSE